jgi:nucleotide-binding universal stress UspA family protein
MSVDNVIAVAAAADGGPPEAKILLLTLGLGLSIPLIIFGSQLLLSVMERYPAIITMGAALLGWVAGDMAVTDPVVKTWVDLNAAYLHWAAPLIGAILVVVLGKGLAARKAQASSAAAVASSDSQAPLAIVGPGWARRVLVAVDGSDGAADAIKRALALRQELRNPAEMELHVINVQRSMTGDVSTFVAASSIESYHLERSEAALAPARAMLSSARVPFEEHTVVGAPGPTIAEAAKAYGCDLIVLGSRGLGGHTAALLGSVVQGVLEHATVPVLVAK